MINDIKQLINWFNENDIEPPVDIDMFELNSVFTHAKYFKECVNTEMVPFIKRMKEYVDEKDIFYIRFLEYQYKHIYPLLAMRASDNRTTQLNEMKEFIIDCICEEICDIKYFGFDEQIQPLLEIIADAIRTHFKTIQF